MTATPDATFVRCLSLLFPNTLFKDTGSSTHTHTHTSVWGDPERPWPGALWTPSGVSEQACVGCASEIKRALPLPKSIFICNFTLGRGHVSGRVLGRALGENGLTPRGRRAHTPLRRPGDPEQAGGQSTLQSEARVHRNPLREKKVVRVKLINDEASDEGWTMALTTS